MKIYVGADHRGYHFKEKVINVLTSFHCDVVDLGTHDEALACDYPKVAYKVATEVAKTRNSRGILVCLSGIGQAMAANKVRNAYAALCYNPEAAQLSRQHNNANILVLSSKFVKPDDIEKIIRVWLNTKFEGGRHRRRFNQIRKIEEGLKLN